MILLFFFSKKIIRSISQVLFRFTKNHKVVVNILAIIFLPGTIFHELSHLLAAGLMLVPVGELKALPEIEGETVKLGSVQIAKVDPFRLTIIGVAPVIFGMLSILGILYYAQDTKNLNWWQILIGLYFIFEFANTMFSSKKDVEGTAIFVGLLSILIISLILALYFINPTLLSNFWIYINSLNLTPLSNFFKLGSLYLLVPLSLDLLIIFLANIFTRRL